MTPEICPNCGAEVPRNAKACPECGSDETTGWSEAAQTDGLDLPDEHFDYEDFVQREFGAKKPIRRGIRWFYWCIAAVMLFVLLVFLLR
ncbi:MAG TPA: zinc-ribbon domain-containing protein [Candidatus Limnocylindrales bacterium]|jgi:uncharacterized membrane protein YvbJ|nr:zinc-ribbon domain-containing protein [Candidatus Limnocylindrales bacterium]